MIQNFITNNHFTKQNYSDSESSYDALLYDTTGFWKKLSASKVVREKLRKICEKLHFQETISIGNDSSYFVENLTGQFWSQSPYRVEN